MNLPSFVNLEMRETVSGGACGLWLWPLDKRSPFGAITTLVGWVKASGGFPATPGLPSVNRTLPSGLNLTTTWPFPFSRGTS